MGSAIGKIRKEVLSLSVTERASLAHDLIISLDDPSSFNLGDAYESEIQRRVKGIKQGKSHGRPAAGPPIQMKGVFFLPEAEQELNEAIAYYENITRGLGSDLLHEVEQALLYVQHFPEGAERHRDETRRHLIKRFPYILVYFIWKDSIQIIAVAHCKAL